MKRTLIAAALMVPAMAMAEEVKPSFSGEAELGATITSGNTKTTSVKGKIDVNHHISNWDNQYLLEGLYKDDTQKDENDVEQRVKTAENYRALVQGNYRFTETNYLFINGTYEVDEFGGYDWRGKGSAGYGHRFYENGSTILDVEIGPGYVTTQYPAKGDGTADNPFIESRRDQEWVAHGKLNFSTDISDSATFKQLFIVDAGNRVDARSETSISASLVGSLAMKVAVVVKYNSDPEPTFKNTDTETNVTLLYKF
ncbi:DUF481 domain-containing protein [Paraferrimonas haliotis]|uniref:DUF481 domain-containing protein n=1 Tax=Paraferrimonas haliotis TaxID=2013866 RepID=A0AA37WYH0_9GAMM|nr:DUF481 domain-containing protein [Paraferrimonas haliotis]GLS83076.1 hypothetical protein GCM10007894_10530 [Paraferrimonas haliotis]